jgi:hypothetical protein
VGADFRGRPGGKFAAEIEHGDAVANIEDQIRVVLDQEDAVASLPDRPDERPEAHDYPAALDYLTLLLEEKAARRLITKLRKAPTVRKHAKDLLRASRLPLLPRDNVHVAGDLRKIKKGKALSPVLLVRGNARLDLPLLVADGYHRICASWYRDENILIACRIVSLER